MTGMTGAMAGGTTGGTTGGVSSPGAVVPAAGATRIEVRPDEVAALGEAMARVATDLQWNALAVHESVWALGPGHSAGALDAVLGDFEHQRLVLGRALDDLAAAARDAGARYVEVEQQVGGMFDAGGAP